MNYIKSKEALMYKYRISAWAISGLCHLQTVVTSQCADFKNEGEAGAFKIPNHCLVIRFHHDTSSSDLKYSFMSTGTNC